LRYARPESVPSVAFDLEGRFLKFLHDLDTANIKADQSRGHRVRKRSPVLIGARLVRSVPPIRRFEVAARGGTAVSSLDELYPLGPDGAP